MNLEARSRLRKSCLRTVLIFSTFLLLAGAVQADISGMIIDEASAPIAGVSVHLQADPTGPVVVTAADGTFTLPIVDPGSVMVSASLVYDPDRAVNYLTDAVSATNPSTGLVIQLREVPSMTNASYDPPGVVSCQGCHIEITSEWMTSVHSTAAEDFWVRDLYSGDGSPGGSAGFVFLDTHDPGDSGTCATCHSPMADAFDPGNVRLNDAFASGDPAALDGVSCLACHQLHRVDGDVNAIHTLGQSEYRFPDGDLSTDRFVWGPLDDEERSLMRASYAPFFSDSVICSSCHQYLAPFGQTTYEEWQASPFAVPGPDFRSCQDCHMPTRGSSGTACNVGGPPTRPDEQLHAHTFIGSTPAMLSANLDLDVQLSQSDGEVIVQASVTNFGAGHDFPTGVSIRNAFVVIQAEIDGIPLAQTGGPTIPDWASDDVPGIQPGDYGGQPGKGFAKILEGRINGSGPTVWPVLFVDAENVREDTNIPSGATDVTEVRFAPSAGAELGDPLRVEARLLYRRAFRALAVTKGWTVTPQGGDIEIEVAAQAIDSQLTTTPIPIPTLGSFGLIALTFILGWAGYRRLNRQAPSR